MAHGHLALQMNLGRRAREWKLLLRLIPHYFWNLLQAKCLPDVASIAITSTEEPPGATPAASSLKVAGIAAARGQVHRARGHPSAASISGVRGRGTDHFIFMPSITDTLDAWKWKLHCTDRAASAQPPLAPPIQWESCCCCLYYYFFTNCNHG